MSLARGQYERFRQLICEFAKFGVVGVAGVFITNAVYDLLFLHLGAGPVTSTTIATIVAMVATYLGNRYWSFRARQRTGVVRELVIFAVLNGIGLLIQDASASRWPRCSGSGPTGGLSGSHRPRRGVGPKQVT